MNTKKDMEDTINIIQDNLDDASKWSANNDDALSEYLAVIQQTLVYMRNKLKKL